MRITERDNPITRFIDQATPRQFMNLIGVTEGQLFGSPQWGKGLLGMRFLANLKRLQGHIQDCFAAGGKVVIGGAGTSGRLAVSVAATHGTDGLEGKVVGLLAGGMNAFFQAREGVEDSPKIGEADLLGVLEPEEPLVYIGVTCGLSAAYVAGQVSAAMKREHAVVAVLGFNRLEDASERELPGLHESFRDILERLVRRENGLLLNPIIGPEPITGSTRMKGGSATRLILDMLLRHADPLPWVRAAQELQNHIYASVDLVLPILEAAAQALNEGRRITYLAGPRKGMTALLDASECPPTFGALPQQITALVPGEITTVLRGFNAEAHALAEMQPDDLLIVLDEALGAAIPQDHRGPVLSLAMAEEVDVFLNQLPETWRLPLMDLGWKWWFNLISTGAFVQVGKVYGNRMIDLRISNLKLWERAVRIVAEVSGKGKRIAERALRAAVPGAEEKGLRGEDRVSLAAVTEKVVPLAILMARYEIPREEAMARLASQPKLTDALKDPPHL